MSIELQKPAPYPLRPAWVQLVCPSPKRYMQWLIVKHQLHTGLDIGCGSASPLTALRGPQFRSTGIDPSRDCIDTARKQQLHDEYMCGDFRTLNFDRKFDVVVLSHVIEHFDHDEAMDVLRRVEKLARRLIYVETPYGFLEQTAYDGNPFQRHLSGWFPHDFQSRGYTVFGSAPRALRGSQGKARYFPEPVVRALARALQWYYFRRPHKAAVIAAIKYIDETGNTRSL